MIDNVVWKAAGYMVKGDYHNITGNLGEQTSHYDIMISIDFLT